MIAVLLLWETGGWWQPGTGASCQSSASIHSSKDDSEIPEQGGVGSGWVVAEKAVSQEAVWVDQTPHCAS